jgi:hypothetical protein
MMNAKKLHEICYEAYLECPQAREWEGDEEIPGFGRFYDIPKKGILNVYNYWKDDRILWEMNYYKALPDNIQKMFDEIEVVIQKAVNEYLKTVK